MNLTIALQEIWAKQPHLILIAGFIILVGFVSKMKLFAKANQPIAAAFVPGWDLIIIMRIIGRPDKHAWYFAIPILNIFFGFKVMVQLAQTFGKRTNTDALLVCLFNFFYVLNLALSYEEEYVGPVYQDTIVSGATAIPGVA
jgi:signal peptidase I